MTFLPRDYDHWRLSGPHEPAREGQYEGETCNRAPEPDEDAPSGYRPRRCAGEMIDLDGAIYCDTCGEIAE